MSLIKWAKWFLVTFWRVFIVGLNWYKACLSLYDNKKISIT